MSICIYMEKIDLCGAHHMCQLAETLAPHHRISTIFYGSAVGFILPGCPRRSKQRYTCLNTLFEYEKMFSISLLSSMQTRDSKPG